VGVGHLDVLIAGAGPTGLAMAAEAARFGLQYEIIDKAPHGAEQSNALIIYARTLEQFEHYDIAQRAVECGTRLKRIRIYSDGQRMLESAFDEIPSRYPFVLFLPQSQTERLLAEHIESLGGQIHRGVTLESFVDRADGVECTLLHGDGSRETIHTAYLIGCDGADSAVRNLLGESRDEGRGQFDICMGDMHVDGDVAPDELRVHLHDGRVVFIGRIDETHSRVMIAPCNIAGEREPELGDFQSAIDDAAVENVRVSEPAWMGKFRLTNRYRPFYGRGHVFLAGDAASIYAPVSGEGLNAGIQDAGNLMWKIALVRTKRAGAHLLDSYAAERTPHARARSDGTASNWFLQRVRDALVVHLSSLNVVQDRLRNALAELGASYRDSPIVRDCGGSSELQAGDRAPDCETVDETATRLRMFDLLKEPLHSALAVTPTSEPGLQRFTALLAKHRDVMQGCVLVDGDKTFREEYADPAGVLYVVRPDGYVGFRAAAADVQALEAWCGEVFSV
jgi:2-polyprenyl-6-methoxyphenol hydroxylase-like FAD-dependent oxidoreductase